MRQEKLAAIRTLIAMTFPGVDVEEKHDFDLDAARFKIHAETGALLLKVAGVYLDDHDIATIEGDFTRWKALDLLKETTALLVTSAGPQALAQQ